MKRIALPIIFACALSLGACTDQTNLPTAVDLAAEEADGTINLKAQGKPGGGGSTDTDSRAGYTFDSQVPNGYDSEGNPTSVTAVIQSDGNGAYVGGECGVHGKIFWYNPDLSQSGDAVFDPDKNKDAKCPEYPRKLKIAGLAAGPFMNITNIMDVPRTNRDGSEIDPGRVIFDGMESTLTSTTGAVCARIEFTDALWEEKTASIKPDQAGQWVVQSNPANAHQANCLVWQKGGYSVNGTVAAPFRVTVDEIFAN